MILAAGRGERMRPLTDTCPKPLLVVRGKPLMQWHLEALAAGGFGSAVVNTAWLGEQIEEHFSSENAWSPAWNGAVSLSNQEQLVLPLPQLRYSHEGRDFGAALETAGGIVRALPLLGNVFWVTAGDVFAPGFAFTRTTFDRFAASDALAHLWLVPNPEHNPHGDFGLGADGQALNLPRGAGHTLYTFSTIALYKRAFFTPGRSGIEDGNPTGIKAPLAPMLRAEMDNGRISAEIYNGEWLDVGTPERLATLNAT